MLDPHSECSKVTSFLDAFHDGELVETEKEAVLAHLASCEECLGRLQEIEKLVGSLRGLPRLEMPPLQLDWSAYLERQEHCEEQAATVPVLATANKVHGQVVPITPLRGFFNRRSTIAAAAGLVLLVVAGSGVIQHYSLAVPGFSLADKPVDNQLSKQDASVPLVAANSSLPNHGGEQQEKAGGRSHSLATQTVQRNSDNDLIALYSNDANLVSEELGIATDEDGLYALKL